jgi:hypothetical protein
MTEELSAQIRLRLAGYLTDDAPDPLNLRSVVAQFRRASARRGYGWRFRHSTLCVNG